MAARFSPWVQVILRHVDPFLAPAVQVLKTGAMLLAVLYACSPLAPTPAKDRALAPANQSAIYDQGFESGPINGTNTPGLVVSTQPGVTVEWQTSIARTGSAAYHFVGGPLQGDGTIRNQSGTLPFGGLEIWVGAALRFESFPDKSPRPI